MTIAEQYYVYHREEMIQADPTLFSWEGIPGAALGLCLSSESFAAAPGVFTTSRTFSAPDGPPAERFVLGLESHIERLQRDASAMGLLGSSTLHQDGTIARRSAQALIAHRRSFPDIKAQRFRILIRHPECLEIWIEALTEEHLPRQPQRLQPLRISRRIPEHKTTLTAASQEARAAAQNAGFDDALLLGAHDEVLEASWSNFFWFNYKGELNTASKNILPGIVRDLILEHHPVRTCAAKLTEVLKQATEAFISNSVIGIIPISVIGEREFPAAPGPKTQIILNWYRQLIKDSARPLSSFTGDAN